MDYRLSWLATLIVVAVAVLVGVASAVALRGPVRNLWALLVALVFTAAACTAVVFDYSWMFGEASRELAQSVALGAGVTGIVYAMRAPG